MFKCYIQHTIFVFLFKNIQHFIYKCCNNLAKILKKFIVNVDVTYEKIWKLYICFYIYVFIKTYSRKVSLYSIHSLPYYGFNGFEIGLMVWEKCVLVSECRANLLTTIENVEVGEYFSVKKYFERTMAKNISSSA